MKETKSITASHLSKEYFRVTRFVILFCGYSKRFKTIAEFWNFCQHDI